jgi:hypothetical protein
MKTIIIALILGLAVQAGAGEVMTSQGSSGSMIGEVETMTLSNTFTPVNKMMFGYDKDEGALTWEGGVFKFSGNPDASAVVFLDWLQRHYNNRKVL